MPTIMPLTVEIQTKCVRSRGRVLNYPKEIVKKNNSNKGEAVGGSQNAWPDIADKSY